LDKAFIALAANRAGHAQPDFFRPALLEFRSDDFMKDFLAVAGSKRPDGLQQVIAQQRLANRSSYFSRRTEIFI